MTGMIMAADKRDPITVLEQMVNEHFRGVLYTSLKEIVDAIRKTRTEREQMRAMLTGAITIAERLIHEINILCAGTRKGYPGSLGTTIEEFHDLLQRCADYVDKGD